jgi:hypothetical protein
MSTKYYISAFCAIKDGSINTNHSITFSDKNVTGEEFLKLAYKHYQLNYPKFYKMDALSKLGFLTSDLLLKNNPVTSRYAAEDIAIVTANSSSSLESDTEHQRTISSAEDALPSPSVFVYTLPNILVGEIAIRNSIKGENTFFIFDKFDAGFISGYVNKLLDDGKAKCCICGWVEYFKGSYHSFLYTVEAQPGIIHEEHNTQNLIKLFQ